MTTPLGAEDQSAAEVIALLTESGATVGTAESLTGGLLAAALISVPGASAVVRGGVIAYAGDLKATLLGVPAGLLQRRGAVDPDVAAAMAAGARDLLGASVGVATTGVAGPEPSDGKPVGTVHIAVRTPGRTALRSLALDGSRARIRSVTVRESLALLCDVLREQRA